MERKDKPTKPKTEIDLSDLLPKKDAYGGAGSGGSNRGGGGNRTGK